MADIYQDGTEELLKRKTPTYRQAYSDRTAWFMSCISELAYKRFNEFIPGINLQRFVEEELSKLVSDKSPSKTAKFISMVQGLAYDHQEELKELIRDLTYLNTTLVKTFDKNGTQAILVETEQFYVLSFRGTEATSIRDIKSDTNAVLTKCTTKGFVHSGFKQAYEQVESEIVLELKKLEDGGKPIFITGHSLGGAIATIATKKLRFKSGIAACYTFGSPRVGDHEWISEIKTPLHRVVNAADCVTMLPPNGVAIGVLAMSVAWLPNIGARVSGCHLNLGDTYMQAICVFCQIARVSRMTMFNCFIMFHFFIV
ncbi:lipase family protein [Vibrio gazogenes]|uniref:Lipase (Class 3) n=1 Tax=Vibrio gazogenes DSM 21264 = NBRC 103151 TaxID=1123492 RepID=A0A1M5HL86_VIBGA|nr:lipase family protein [Vibrio gazogenes]USP14505.1 lipase family protein [Vibrio gazogenes]SHG16709.1 Lipase (class 3) [Vibrio gazogenes DSM 21264] [Vibrio gazogenes DSM 21264 = NBRC 103151]SJN57665.1 Lipase (class 3) [Vibrio gazogenes]